jgi:RNA polymerase sigma factor (sigma-70 family)
LPAHSRIAAGKKTNENPAGGAIRCRKRFGPRMMNMAVHRLTKVIQHLRRTTLADEARVSDGQLLDQFIENQDETAFAALVERHSRMVWGVCRRIVAHHQDAEDAFQATFLVLARKAMSIRPREMVANWLFGVAHRTALKAKTMAAKRSRREKQVTTMPEPEAAGPGSWGDLESLIDQELANLPDKYRIVIVLCDLEGKKGKDVARQLKIPEGTLASRLRTGRVMLAKRLARQGLALSGGALATVFAQNAASACAPTGLVSSTIKAATLTAAGKTAAATLISANAAALMEGVIKAMLLTKLKTAIAVVLVLGMVALGGGLLAHHAAVGQQLPAAEREKSANQQAVPGIKDAAHPRADGEKAPEVVPPKPVRKKETLPTKNGKIHPVAYPVADLVVPIEGLDVALGSNQKEPIKTKEDWLIKKIMRTVSPASWEGSGGTGTIDYFPLGMALVVNNTPRVQAQVKYLLETMQRVQEVQVAAETRIISLKAASFLKLQELLPQLQRDGHAVLSEAETSALLRKAQDDADNKVVLLPKMTFFPGQRLSLTIMGPSKDLPGIKKIDVKLNALVAANLQHLDLEVKATVGQVDFSKALRLEEGMTLAQLKRNGDGYLILLVTPRVTFDTEPEVAPPEAESDPAVPPRPPTP